MLYQLSYSRARCSFALASQSRNARRRDSRGTRQQGRPWPAPVIAQRGVASGSPPSTGSVAPVVGVARVAKKSTAFAT